MHIANRSVKALFLLVFLLVSQSFAGTSKPLPVIKLSCTRLLQSGAWNAHYTTAEIDHIRAAVEIVPKFLRSATYTETVENGNRVVKFQLNRELTATDLAEALVFLQHALYSDRIKLIEKISSYPKAEENRYSRYGDFFTGDFHIAIIHLFAEHDRKNGTDWAFKAIEAAMSSDAFDVKGYPPDLFKHLASTNNPHAFGLMLQILNVNQDIITNIREADYLFGKMVDAILPHIDHLFELAIKEPNSFDEEVFFNVVRRYTYWLADPLLAGSGGIGLLGVPDSLSAKFRFANYLAGLGVRMSQARDWPEARFSAYLRFNSVIHRKLAEIDSAYAASVKHFEKDQPFPPEAPIPLQVTPALIEYLKAKEKASESEDFTLHFIDAFNQLPGTWNAHK